MTDNVCHSLGHSHVDLCPGYWAAPLILRVGYGASHEPHRLAYSEIFVMLEVRVAENKIVFARKYRLYRHCVRKSTRGTWAPLPRIKNYVL